MARASSEQNGSDHGMLAWLRAAASAIAGRAQWAERANLTFGGQRNVSKALGYADFITPAMYRTRYERGDIAESIVEAFPKATWGAKGCVYDDDDTETETPFETAAKELFKQLQVWPRMLRLDVLAGLGRYGVMLLGSAQNLEQERDGKLPVLSLQPLGEEQCTVESLDADKESERFGQPLFYQVRLGTVTGIPVPGSVAGLTRRVHHSHIIHFVEGNLADDIFGEPRLRSVWNKLDDLDKLVGGGGEAAWHRAHPGMNAKFDPEMAAGMSDSDLAALKEKISEQYAEYEHNQRRLFQTVGVELDALSGGPFPFDSSAKLVIALIAAAKGIPQRKLLGSGIGEMTGKSEDDNFNDEVATRRTSVAEPALRKLVDHFIEVGQLPEPKDGKYEIEWPVEEEMSESEKTAAAGAIATANQAQKNAGGDPIMTSAEIRNRIWGLDPIPEEELPKPPPAPVLPGVPLPGAEDDNATEEDAQRAAAEPAWKATHKVADAYAPRLEAAFRSAFDRVRDKVDMEALEQAALEGNRVKAEELLAAAVALFGELLDEELPAQAATLFAVASERRAIDKERKFSSTQVQLPPEIAKKLLAYSLTIPDAALAADGRENDPHVTVKYGLHTQDADEVRSALAGQAPAALKLGKTAIFASEEYDVLYVSVTSMDLERLNKKIASALVTTDTHPTYIPHACVAYLKPGLGKNYIGDARFEGLMASVSEVVFSDADSNKSVIQLVGGGL